MKKILLIISIFIMLGFAINVNGQVTIGSEIHPRDGSLLDLKEKVPADPAIDNSTANRGLGFPRVKLSDSEALFPMFLKNPADPSSGANDKYKADTDYINIEHTGLVVYNVGTLLPEGLYCWDGKQWNLLANTITKTASIGALVCEDMFVDGSQTFVNGDVNFSTIVRVPYTGGNGGSYPDGPVIDCMTGNDLVTGLKAQLQAGNLAEGKGELIYKIWASPAVSGNSPSVAKFSVSFNDESGSQVSCIISVGNSIPIAKTESYASIGPLIPTIDSEHQEEIAKSYYVPGYERVVTTPDGRWSMRAFIGKKVNFKQYNGQDASPSWDHCTLNEVDISIRANNMDGKDRYIMWAANVTYQGGNWSASHILEIPAKASDRWGGNQRGVGNGAQRGGSEFFGLYPGANTTHNGMNVGWQVALANPNVFDSSSPENRIYTFTEIGNASSPAYLPRTVYTITFMMGAVAENLGKEVNNAVAATTTVYFKVEQSTSMD